MVNRLNLGLFIHGCLLTPMGAACIFLSAGLKIEFAKIGKKSEKYGVEVSLTL